MLTGPLAAHRAGLIRPKCDEGGRRTIELEVMPDNVRLVVKARRADPPSYIANQVRGFTSRMLREEFPSLRSRLRALWSRSFFVATVGVVSLAAVRRRCIDTRYDRPWRKGRLS